MKSSVPRYHHVKSELLLHVECGDWAPGDMIPSEAQLSEIYQVSRTTIRLAVGDLVSMGYLVRQQGKGTYVTERVAASSASRLYGFVEEFRARGERVDVRIDEVRAVRCPDVIADCLRVADGWPLVYVARRAFVGYTCVFRDVAYFVTPSHIRSSDLVQHPDEVESIYGFFERNGVKIALGKQWIRAELANQLDAEAFRIEVGAPILVIVRITQDEAGTPVEHSEVRYPAKQYEYEVTLVRNE